MVLADLRGGPWIPVYAPGRSKHPIKVYQKHDVDSKKWEVEEGLGISAVRVTDGGRLTKYSDNMFMCTPFQNIHYQFLLIYLCWSIKGWDF